MALVVIFTGGPAVAADVDYLRDIKPILQTRCVACHGALKQESGLRLDAWGAIRAGGDTGAVITAGQPAASPLLARLAAAEGERMPPEGEPLTAEQQALFQAWVAQGASGPEEPLPADPREHWAFRVPTRPPLPASNDPRNPVDLLIELQQQAEGLVPLGRAAPEILLRRVHLDLTGLPPTPAELEQFLADPSPLAYAAVVDGLLASPQYGERWARHWMDVWRYSDWAGFAAEVRYSQRHIWRWRDWIVESLNADHGYDQMLEEMLAADELAPSDPARLRATGFLVRNWYRFNRNTWLDATVEHTSKAFLGLTLNCARCHDHKYDPLAQEDYYRFRAFFEPHDVRTDRVPGQADLLQDGLPRVFDKDLTTATYLFERGNDAHPRQDQPLPPAVPAALGGLLAITPINLPPEASYPALAPFVQDEAIAVARAAVDATQATLLAAQQAAAQQLAAQQAAALPAADAASAPLTPPDVTAAVAALADPAVAPGETPVAVLQPSTSELAAAVASAEQALTAAQVQLMAVQARVAADIAGHATPPAANSSELALRAANAHRRAEVLRAQVALEAAGLQLAAAQQASKPEDANSQMAVTAAQAAVDVGTKALEAARQAEANPTVDYPPLGESYPTTSSGRRLALARWITSADNPLTARVAVNHLWLRHFGSPLVPTMFDFGHNGSLPTHPALLDWLAVELRDSGWKMKSLHRLLVTSDAYCRQSSPPLGSPNLALDPDNRRLWRMNARRLEAEAVRDSVLFVAGNLDLSLGGPALDQTTGLTSPRRSLYFHHAYEKKMLFLTLFDGASENECYQRDTSIMPQQALALANSRLTLNHARRLAATLRADLAPAPPAEGATNGVAVGQPAAEDFVRQAYARVLSRYPTAAEMAQCVAFLAEQAQRLADLSQLTPVTNGTAADVPPSPDPAQRARENLVHVLMNHHDFVTLN